MPPPLPPLPPLCTLLPLLQFPPHSNPLPPQQPLDRNNREAVLMQPRKITPSHVHTQSRSTETNGLAG
jgi:hypothetical protein